MDINTVRDTLQIVVALLNIWVAILVIRRERKSESAPKPAKHKGKR